MTRDEIRGLIGGYATGSLSADERKALFDAALDDQDLFDELAGEQALKELLDQPGVKARLKTVLESPQRPWWNNVWAWGAVGGLVAAGIVGVATLKTPSSPPREIAQVTSRPAAPGPPSPVPAAPPASPAASAGPAPGPQASIDSPVVAPAAKKAEPLIQIPAPQIPVPPAPLVVNSLGAADSSLQKTEAPAAAAPPPPAPAALGFAAAGGAGGGGGGRGGGRGGAAPRAVAALAAPVRFAFDYSLTPEGVLRITPAAAGFLTVTVNNTAGSTELVSGRAVPAGSVTDVPMPADAVTAQVVFSAQAPPAAPAAQANEAFVISGTTVGGALDPASGTKSDPNPTPTSRLAAIIPVKR